MIIALFSLAEASIAQAVGGTGNRKPPSKRISIAHPERKLAPEPR